MAAAGSMGRVSPGWFSQKLETNMQHAYPNLFLFHTYRTRYSVI